MGNKIRSRTYRVNLILTENSGVTSWTMTNRAGRVLRRLWLTSPRLLPLSPLMDRRKNRTYTGRETAKLPDCGEGSGERRKPGAFSEQAAAVIPPLPANGLNDEPGKYRTVGREALLPEVNGLKKS